MGADGDALLFLEVRRDGAWHSLVVNRQAESQHADIDRFLTNFPEIEISFDAKVEDEEDVQEGDVLSLTVKVERKHLLERLMRFCVHERAPPDRNTTA